MLDFRLLVLLLSIRLSITLTVTAFLVSTSRSGPEADFQLQIYAVVCHIHLYFTASHPKDALQSQRSLTSKQCVEKEVQSNF